MKKKFSSMGRVAIALVLALSFSLVMAVPAAAVVATVEITSPTGVVPEVVNVEAAPATVTVEFTVTTDLVAPATDDANIIIRIGPAGDPVAEDIYVDTVGDVTPLTRALEIPQGTAEDSYDVYVTVDQPVGGGGWVNDIEVDAVVVDHTPPTIEITTLTAPDGGELWKAGSTQNIIWTEAEITDDNLLANPITLSYSTDAGVSWTQIDTDLAKAPGTYSWDTLPSVVSETCRVKIVAEDEAGNKAEDTSDANFTIWAIDTTLPTVTLDTPATDAFISGATYAVTATADDPESGINQVVFEYSLDEGASWTVIGTTTEDPYSVAWDTNAFDDGEVVDVRATATNGVNATNSATNTGITLDNTPPH